MKKALVAAVFALSFAVVSRAQDIPRADVALGYSSMWVGKGDTFFLHGSSGSIAVNANHWFALAGDFGAYHADPGVNLTTESYTLGPRFTYRRWNRLTTFAQVLLGRLHSSAMTTGFTNASDAFAFSAGAANDIDLDGSGRFALRQQLEYAGFRAKGATTGTVRISVGIVFRFGKKHQA